MRKYSKKTEENRSSRLFLHLTCAVNAHLRQVNCASRYCVTYENSLIIDDFCGLGSLVIV